MQRIPDDSTIFTAETKAIDLALDYISTCDANNKGSLTLAMGKCLWFSVKIKVCQSSLSSP